jgi:hypothetical protein
MVDCREFEPDRGSPLHPHDANGSPRARLLTVVRDTRVRPGVTSGNSGDDLGDLDSIEGRAFAKVVARNEE